MSHFTVLVIGEKAKKQLAPFQQNNMGDCPIEYLQFVDVETEQIKEYQTGGSEMIEMEDGELVYAWDRIFKVGDFLNEKTVIPEHLKRKFVKFTEKYKTFEDFLENWCGYSKDKKTNKYGYWENPNAKWDWCELGGRWTGFFKLKENGIGGTGKPGLMTEKAGDGTADMAYKEDIDFDGMREDAGIEAAKKWDEVHSIIDNYPSIISWETMREEVYKNNIEEARNAYHNQPALIELKKNQELRFCNVEDYICSRDEYIARKKNESVCTFAVLKDGKWYERGEMGWWGIVSNEKNKNQWFSEMNKLIDELPDQTLLSVYDCHI